MNDEDLRNLWLGQPLPSNAGPTAQEQMNVIGERVRKFNKTIRARDLKEHAAALVVFVCFGLYLWTGVPALSRLGCWITMSGAVFTVVFPMWCKRGLSKASADQPVIERLRMDLRRVSIEVRLLRSILWWYLLPLMLGAVLFKLGLREPRWTKVTFALFCLASTMAFWWINQMAVKRQLLPLKRELETLLGTE